MRHTLPIILAAVLATGIFTAPAAAAPDPLLAALQQAEAAGALAAPQGVAYRQVLADARAVRDGLRGVRRREMSAALTVAGSIAKRGQLTDARMPAVFLTLARNAQWWAVNGPPTPGSPGEQGARGRRCRPLPARARAARVSFPGSELVFQYYPGLGLQLQVNGTWAEANALFGSSNPAFWARGAALLGELLPLGTMRDGVLAWEYEFPILGGRPPWVSSLSQATAVQALTRAAGRLGRPDLLSVAGAAAGAFASPPPTGVRIALGGGMSWFALYSFAPRLRVLNAHLDALAALFDFAQASGDPAAKAAYAAGLLAAHRRIRGYDTGVWSKYANPGALADLNYHVLNTTLSQAVCQRSGDAAICRAASSFARELERRCPRVGTAASAGGVATAEEDAGEL
jgi:D-glucuronyl C5-epimerase-like protein